MKIWQWLRDLAELSYYRRDVVLMRASAILMRLTLEELRRQKTAALRRWVDAPRYGIERRADGSTVLWLPAVVAR